MKRVAFIIALSLAIFNGCETGKEQSAVFVDSVVEGVEYQCAGLVKYTKADGKITCTHTPLAVKVGEIVLGKRDKLPADGILLPQDLVGVSRSNLKDENVQKILILLQSLDADKNPENGITITKETRDALKKLTFIEDVSLDELKEIVESQLGDVEFVERRDAIEHLQRSMKSYSIDVPNIELDDIE